MKIPHLIQYQGSKRALAPAIAYYIPSSTQRLVEPFCGTCALSIYAACTMNLPAFWINDLNADVASMMDTCIQTPEELSAAYTSIWQGQFEEGVDPVAYFFVQRDRLNQEHQPAQMLFMLARVVKGAIRYNAKGEMNQSCDKRRTGTQPKTITANARQISALLKGKTICTDLDYTQVLKEVSPTDVVYMDPPYQGTSTRKDGRYIEGVDAAAFADQLRMLNKRDIPYMVSYDGSTGSKTYGPPLPEDLHLTKIALPAGRSAQATLLGKNETTIESLYLSPALCQRLEAEGRPLSKPESPEETAAGA